MSNEIKSQHTLYHARRSCFCLLECGGEKEALPDIWEVGGGGTLGLFGWGCAVGTLESLAYTRASSSEFCYPILD